MFNCAPDSRHRYIRSYRRSSDYSRERYTLKTEAQELTRKDWRFIRLMRIKHPWLRPLLLLLLRPWSKRHAH